MSAPDDWQYEGPETNNDGEPFYKPKDTSPLPKISRYQLSTKKTPLGSPLPSLSSYQLSSNGLDTVTRMIAIADLLDHIKLLEKQEGQAIAYIEQHCTAEETEEYAEDLSITVKDTFQQVLRRAEFIHEMKAIVSKENITIAKELSERPRLVCLIKSLQAIQTALRASKTRTEHEYNYEAKKKLKTTTRFIHHLDVTQVTAQILTLEKRLQQVNTSIHAHNHTKQVSVPNDWFL